MKETMALSATTIPKTKKKRNKKKASALRKFMLLFLILVVILPILGWTTLTLTGMYLVGGEKIKAIETSLSQGNIYGHEGTLVTVNQMPAYIPKAFVGIEDHRFYKHYGIDPISLGRAIWTDMKDGQKNQGASTITMQVARNLFLSGDKTYTRKFKEMAIATELENKFSKEEILNLYLNNIYFGNGQYGIEAADQYYFGKTTRLNDPQKPVINLSEAAMLAGMVKGPEAYNPLKNKDKALKRQQVVLNRMAQLGLISKQEKEEALQKEVAFISKTVKPAS
ncbi:biosynthetic peptidoglycan transglycosylase [Paenibacillus larvae]